MVEPPGWWIGGCGSYVGGATSDGWFGVSCEMEAVRKLAVVFWTMEEMNDGYGGLVMIATRLPWRCGRGMGGLLGGGLLGGGEGMCARVVACPIDGGGRQA
ncbi:hypothetical protein Tco_0861918 [Tanacetum coccineum]